jgi:hypothetical protein
MSTIFIVTDINFLHAAEDTLALVLRQISERGSKGHIKWHACPVSPRKMLGFLMPLPRLCGNFDMAESTLERWWSMDFLLIRACQDISKRVRNAVAFQYFLLQQLLRRETAGATKESAWMSAGFR